ncbi:MAG TPA: glucose-6-phosphate dehydrogenase assembly protein OpcA [Thermoleophilaceae bacterium]|nr:glucose-6-phosphate dehydrogenase assembly protein OpcA [Thermoleophilaceae bacterium]
MAPKVAPEVPDEGAVWSEQDTTPSAIDEALRDLLTQQYARDKGHSPARVLNLVVIVDREWRGEIMNRLEQVGRYHASRTILCDVEPRRTTIDASVVLTVEGERRPESPVLTRERVIIEVGPKHLPKLDTIVDPLVVTDLPTVVWAPHGHPEALDALLHLSQVVLIDSVNEPDPASALKRAEELSSDAYVVDLAWLRTTPWRERVASTFDPPRWREELWRIDSVKVRHRPDSGAAGILFFGWLASRLGWGSASLMPANGSVRGHASARRQDVTLALEPDPEQNAPGLAGIEIGTSSGMSISLDRGPGGLLARRRDPKGREREWTILGASRGEGGILGEGIRQALLRDPAYRSALDSAEAMLR